MMEHRILEFSDPWDRDTSGLANYTGTVYYVNSGNSEWRIDGWVYKETLMGAVYYFDYDRYYTTYEGMFDSLPEEHQNIILWNLDIWRLSSTKELIETLP